MLSVVSITRTFSAVRASLPHLCHEADTLVVGLKRLHFNNPRCIPGKEGKYPGEIDIPVSQRLVGIIRAVVIMKMNMQGFSYGEELIQRPVEVGMAEIQAE